MGYILGWRERNSAWRRATYCTSSIGRFAKTSTPIRPHPHPHPHPPTPTTAYRYRPARIHTHRHTIEVLGVTNVGLVHLDAELVELVSAVALQLRIVVVVEVVNPNCRATENVCVCV